MGKVGSFGLVESKPVFDFGKANPNARQEEVDVPDVAGSLAGDVGGLLEYGAHATTGTRAGAGMGFAGDLLVGASEFAHGERAAGLGDMAAGVLTGAAAVPALTKRIPGLGVAAGLSTAVGHGVEAARHVDEIDKGYQNNQFWTNAGDATLGVADAAAALDPTGVSGMAVGATELALDGAGALSGALFGNDYRFTAGSAVGAGEHMLFDTGQAIAQGAVGAFHGAEHMVSDGWHQLFGH